MYGLLESVDLEVYVAQFHVGAARRSQLGRTKRTQLGRTKRTQPALPAARN